MQPLHSRSGIQNREGGVALVYAVFGAFIAISMVGLMFTTAGVTHRRSELKVSNIKADYLAEGAVEAAKKVVRSGRCHQDHQPSART